MIESMEYSTTILEAELHRMQNHAATVVLRMGIKMLAHRDCQAPFQSWHRAWQQDIHQGERALIEQRFISTEQLLSNAVATLQKEFQSRVVAVQRKADREIVRVKELAAEESELQRLNQLYISRQAQPGNVDSDFFTDASDDEMSVIGIDVAQSSAAPPTAANSLSGLGDGPVDEQLEELKS